MKRFILLRQRLTAASADQRECAARINRGTGYVSQRLAGKAPWDASDMAAMGRWLRIPEAEYYAYFIAPFVGDEQEIRV